MPQPLPGSHSFGTSDCRAAIPTRAAALPPLRLEQLGDQTARLFVPVARVLKFERPFRQLPEILSWAIDRAKKSQYCYIDAWMAEMEIRVFRSPGGQVQLTGWLTNLKRTNLGVWKKCLARITDLAREGYKLQRPLAAPLRDKIYELRPKSGRINYRILYFFHKEMAVLTHGLTKEKAVPPEDIEHAIYCRKLVEIDLEKYTADFG